MFTLVPAEFFAPDSAREALSRVADLPETAKVAYVQVPAYGAVLIYDIPGKEDLPGIFSILEKLSGIKEDCKILCSWKSGALNIAVARGPRLLYAGEFKAADFVTAQYYILFTLKNLRIRAQVSALYFTHALERKQRSELSKYFKSVGAL